MDCYLMKHYTFFLSAGCPVFFFLLVVLQTVVAKEPADDHRSWRVYNGDYGGTKYSALDQINRSNVSELELVWRYRVDDMKPGRRSTIQMNPIMIDGVLYTVSPGLKVIALEAKTGAELWRFDPFPGEGAGGDNRGLVYWGSGDDKRIFHGAGNDYYAINAATGSGTICLRIVCWLSTPRRGSVSGIFKR